MKARHFASTCLLLSLLVGIVSIAEQATAQTRIPSRPSAEESPAPPPVNRVAPPGRTAASGAYESNPFTAPSTAPSFPSFDAPASNPFNAPPTGESDTDITPDATLFEGGLSTIAPVVPEIKPLKVLTGARVFDNITGRLLDDVYYQLVPEKELDSLTPAARDDGVWPDLQKGDGTYSNFEETDQFIGPESNEAKRQIIRIVESAENLTPQEFFLIPATSTDPYSSLPFYVDEEENRDERIKKWNDLFLKKFRKNPNDPLSEFWPIYVPRPPKRPTDAPPPGFVYLIEDEVAEGEEGAGGEAVQGEGEAAPQRSGAPRLRRPGQGGSGGGGDENRGGSPYVNRARDAANNANRGNNMNTGGGGRGGEGRGGGGRGGGGR